MAQFVEELSALPMKIVKFESRIPESQELQQSRVAETGMEMPRGKLANLRFCSRIHVSELLEKK